MTLRELYNVVGERISITMKEGMTTEERMIENEQSALIFEGVKQAVNVGDLILRIEKLQCQTKSLVESEALKLVNGD